MQKSVPPPCVLSRSMTPTQRYTPASFAMAPTLTFTSGVDPELPIHTMMDVNSNAPLDLAAVAEPDVEAFPG